jgi:4-amino-4-deoxychorismate lyase
MRHIVGAIGRIGLGSVTAMDTSATADPAAVLVLVGRGLLAPDEPVLRADDAGVTRGDGCFEGCRVVVDAAGAAVAKLDAHLARMARSAAALEIAFDEPAWRAAVDTALGAWHAPGEAAMKLLLTRGPAATGEPTGLVSVGPLSPDVVRQRGEGITVITLHRGLPSSAFADAPWLLGGVKTLSYAVNMAAYREAARRGADDVVFVSADGAVLEAPTATVVWATGRTLHTTPTGDTGILPGTTQQALFAAAAAVGWRTADTLAPVADLHAADVVWLVSSTRGPVEVIALDGTPRARRPDVHDEIRRLAGF